MNNILFILYFFIIQFFLLKIEANSIKLLNADYAIKHSTFWALKGNIIFIHKNYKIKCKYVKYYNLINKFIGEGDVKITYLSNKIKLYSKYIEYDINKNSYKVYGNPIIYTKKSILTGKNIIYNDNIKLFKFFGNSCFINNKIRLISDKIEYNAINFTIYYKNGGNIYINNNIFFSENAIYSFLDEKIFLKKIYLTNKKNTFISEKIIYYVNNNRINFLGKTLIVKNINYKNFFYIENGMYYINENITILKNNYNIFIYFNNKIIKANYIFFDSKNDNFYLKEDIWLEILNKKQYFIGGYGEIKNNLLIISSNPLLTKIINNSILLISSDFLIYKKKIYYILYAYNCNTYLNKIKISSNYMKYDKNYIEYNNNAKIYFDSKNQIIANFIRVIFNTQNILNSIKIKNNALLFNKVYKIGNFNFNYILSSIINIYFYKNKIKKIFLNKSVKTLSYNFFKLKNKKIFSNIDIKKSDNLILYINNSFTNFFFIGKAKSFFFKKKIINNKKLSYFINFSKKNDNINISLDDYIIYINIKKNIKKHIIFFKEIF